MTLLVCLAAGAASAAEHADSARADFARAEHAVLGTAASQGWRATLASSQGGDAEPEEPRDEFDADAGDDGLDDGRPSNRGRKVRAGVLSAVLPGAGQYYNGHHKKAYIMGGVEVAIWTAYFVFDKQGDNRMESSREWAALFAGVSGSHPNNYWQNIGFYMDDEAYYTALAREARALGEPTPPLVPASDAWQWVNEDRWRGYAKLRADGNSAYDRRDFMILFAVLNRTVAVVDAVLGAGAPDGQLEADVMGLNVKVGLEPVLADGGGFAPQARCVVSRGF